MEYFIIYVQTSLFQKRVEKNPSLQKWPNFELRYSDAPFVVYIFPFIMFYVYSNLSFWRTIIKLTLTQ